jgi:1-acyl-sn-glycerol-3-phosphate acyltransferase
MIRKIEKAWRIFGTGLSFSVFGIGGIIMGVLLFPTVFIFIRNPDSRQRISRAIIGKVFGAFIWFMSSLKVISYTLQGREKSKAGRKQLIVANHPSLIDVVFLVWLFPQADCVIKEAVTKNPFMRSTVAAANYISNSSPEKLLEDCTARLESGGQLILFPEGTRSARGQALDFKLGAAAVAVRSGAEILPIVIHCHPPSLGKREPWYRVPEVRSLWTIRIQESTPVSAWVPHKLKSHKMTRALNDALLEYFNRELT